MQVNKKGQLEMIVPTILLLVIAAAVLVLGLQLMTGFNNISDSYVANVVNESGFINSSGYTLSKATVLGFNSPSVSSAVNGTITVVPSANYTVSSVGLVTNTTPVVYSRVNFTYSYSYGQEAYSSSNKSIVGVAQFADFWSLIVLAVVIVIVVGVILGIMSAKRIK